MPVRVRRSLRYGVGVAAWSAQPDQLLSLSQHPLPPVTDPQYARSLSADMRDEERVRRSQAGVLLGLGVGGLAFAILWASLVVVGWTTGWGGPRPPMVMAGVVAGVLLLVFAKVGAR